MKTRLFIFIVAAQVVFLFAWAGWHEHVRQTGTVLLLETQPVDPRDPVRGDYMILSYKISNALVADAPQKPGSSDYLASVNGQNVWVILKPQGKFYTVASATLALPLTIPDGQILVSGKFDSRRRIQYGIEEYFVPEGKGSPGLGKTVTVQVAVSSDHRMNIKQVFVNGTPYP